ncbi:MAG: histidinol dehydrogenase, partial [Spirochaetia bacterium]
VDVGLPAGPSEAIVLADDTANPRRVAVDLITEAEHGSDSSAFSMANYAVGCNNVIPTGGWAKTCSPLSVRAFLKSSSVVYVTSQGVSTLTGPVADLAEYEGFSAHALAVRLRGNRAT